MISLKLGLVSLIVAVMLVVGAAISVFPYFWLFTSSLKTVEEMFRVPPTILPTHPTLQNYEDLLNWGTLGQSGVQKDMPRVFLNSIVISSVATLVTMIVGSLAGYSLARFRFPGKELLLSGIFITWLLPAVSIIFPIFVIMHLLRLLDTWLALIIVYVSIQLPFAVWIIIGYFQEVPLEIEESALVDGCSRFRTLFTVVMPLAAPGLIACGLLVFIGCWNEFFYALTLTFTTASKTLPVITAETQTSEFFEWGLLIPIGSVIALPAIVLDFIAQRWMVRGLTAGAVKG
jgi:multiple sugar transport system permease protein